MQTDGPLKILLQSYPRDLLVLFGDEGATLQAVENVEIQQMQRRVDGILRLERAGEVYYRHVEFQAEPTADIARRCFEYNAQLLMRYGAPVLTTVVYLFPPGPPEDPVFRVTLCGHEVNRWWFQVVRLWEIEAAAALEQGAPGLVALVPLMRGGSNWDLLTRAVKLVEAALPGEPVPEAESVLLHLAGRHYTFEEILKVVGRERMIQSSVWNEALNEGRTEGRTEGRNEGRTEGQLQAERRLCVKMVEKYHPALLAVARPAIDACSDPDRLEEWVVSAPDLDDEAYARLLKIAWRAEL